MTLVLETLGSNEALDAGCFGVGFFSFALGLDFAADDEFADLEMLQKSSISVINSKTKQNESAPSKRAEKPPPTRRKKRDGRAGSRARKK